MMTKVDTVLTLALPFLILVHLVYSPYTKVEESFNIQATHDIITYGVPTKDIGERLRKEYDHFGFPGVVPRTFTGAVILATFAKAGIATGLDGQMAVRGVLGLLNASAILAFRRAVARSFGRDVGNWYLILQASQFHVIYYASRTLPNMFAFGLTTFALSNFLPVLSKSAGSPRFLKRCKLSIYLLAFTAVVFRSEISVLLATHMAYLLLRQGASLFRDTMVAAISGGIVGIMVTVSIDSFFWQRFPLWPELVGFYYNAIQGKSIAWGFSPWWFYIGNTVPRLMLNPLSWLLCIPLAVGIPATRRPSLDLLLPLLGFLGIYSIQPHKEWRFVVYVIPGLTTIAAIGANWIWRRRMKSTAYRLLSFVLVFSILASLLASFGMLAVSRLNYPGAEALHQLHELHDGPNRTIKIHMDTLSCTTGITRFLERWSPASPLGSNQSLWIYDKTEDPNELLSPLFWDQFDYVLAEKPEKVIGKWEIISTIDGFAGVSVIYPARTENRDLETGQAFRDSEKSYIATPATRPWLKKLEDIIRIYVTRGWWLKTKMEPKIRIMRKQVT